MKNEGLFRYHLIPILGGVALGFRFREFNRIFVSQKKITWCRGSLGGVVALNTAT